MTSRNPSLEQIAAVIRESLAGGAAVEIDGLGSFRKIGNGYRFKPKDAPRIFIAYVKEDAEAAARMFESLAAAGFDPWMDQKKLLPGQNWPRAIQNALETSDFAVAFFSRNSVSKRGGFQAEIRYALECARRLPLDEVFLLPARLDNCPVPIDVARSFQYVDLFPDWDKGVDMLKEAVHRQVRDRRAA